MPIVKKQSLDIYGSTFSVWPSASLSVDGATRHLGEAVAIQVAGRARALFYGPYIELEPSVWRAKFSLTLDSDACIYSYRIEWGSGDHFNSVALQPSLEGTYEVDITYGLEEAVPWELRVIVTEGALAGELTISDIQVSGGPFAGAGEGAGDGAVEVGADPAGGVDQGV